MSPQTFTAKNFAHFCGRLAYIAANTRADVAFLSAKLALVKAENVTEDDANLLNSIVRKLKTNQIDLTCPKLYLSSIKIQ